MFACVCMCLSAPSQNTLFWSTCVLLILQCDDKKKLSRFNDFGGILFWLTKKLFFNETHNGAVRTWWGSVAVAEITWSVPRILISQPPLSRTPLELLDYPAARWRCTSRLSNYGQVNADGYKFLCPCPSLPPTTTTTSSTSTNTQKREKSQNVSPKLSLKKMKKNYTNFSTTKKYLKKIVLKKTKKTQRFDRKEFKKKNLRIIRQPLHTKKSFFFLDNATSP